VLLAGGEGTRLGYDGPKGAMNIGETRELSLYELHFANLKKRMAISGKSIPLFIMTSASTDAETKAFLEEKQYFGYPKDAVWFFEQDMAVCTDFSDKVFFDAEGHIAESPNGNGGWFSSMLKAGLLKTVEQLGIEWLNVFAVDNALQQIADPCFVGAVIESGSESGAKVVGKAAPDERVGVLCLEDGKPSIVEYFEMEKEMSERRNPDGSLTYRYGVILNYLFSMKRLLKIGGANLPIHKAKKKIPYRNTDGERVRPTDVNGYKYETLVLDMVRLQESCLAYEVSREAEFAPIKNRDGVDSLDTARILLKNAGFVL
jgi:UDP-N-acetylglucosamine/UDP-N-acetylgalactosamine diphosphorylase